MGDGRHSGLSWHSRARREVTPGEKQQGKTLAVVEAGQEGRMGTARLPDRSSRYSVRMSKDKRELRPTLGGQAELF